MRSWQGRALLAVAALATVGAAVNVVAQIYGHPGPTASHLGGLEWALAFAAWIAFMVNRNLEVMSARLDRVERGLRRLYGPPARMENRGAFHGPPLGTRVPRPEDPDHTDG